ncbi:MAG: response regulator transcription factor [Sterolibacteriaceae bacterium]|jgi:FixJ family two-component response regulator|nr:response regulator transcription factor [Candidatus Methylophosphatis haderslevensis]
MTGNDLVCVVDDDEMVRLSVGLLIETLGVQVRSYASCLQLIDDEASLKLAGCLVLDVRMPGIGGLEMQERLEMLRVDAPIVFISGHGDVPMVVRAMRAGALDFLQKPFDEQLLLDRVQQAIAISARRRRERVKRATIEARLATLTPRERDVLEGIVAGRQNKMIAEDLGISMKTVEQHRARIMEKMHAASLAELVRHVTELQRGD